MKAVFNGTLTTLPPLYRVLIVCLLAVLFAACDDDKDDKPATYTVTFNTAGGEPAPSVQRIERDSAATEPADPTRQGYAFKGWFTDDGTFANEFDFDTPITGDIVLYAKWEEIPPGSFRVRFDTGEGTSLPDAVVEEGQTATTPPNPTRRGYVFKGWFTDDGTFANEFNFDTLITGDIVLYAKWEEIPPGSFRVRFDTGGGTSLPDAVVEEGQTAAEPSAPTRTYYAFDGWYADEGYTTPFAFSEIITEDRVVYAQWRLDSIGLKVTTYRGNDRLGLAVMEDLFADDELLKLSIEPSEAAQLADLAYTIGNVQKDNVTPVDGSISIAQSDLDNLDPPVDGDSIPVTISSGNFTSNRVTLSYNLYKITHWRDLQAIRQDLTGDYTLENDIALPDGYNFFPIRGADPLGLDEDRFSGNFDGSGHRINNLYIDRPSEIFVGLFGFVADQANVTKAGIAIAPQGITAKAIVGALIGSKVGRGKVSGYAVGPGAIIGQGGRSTGYGGLIGTWDNNGFSTQGELYGYATVDVNTDSPTGEFFGAAGGLAGRATGDITVVGYATGDVKGTFDTGGLVGHSSTFNSFLTITGYATGDVSNFPSNDPTVSTRITGLVGLNGNGPVILGYARGNVTVTDSTMASYGLITRFDNANPKGYHSGKAGESELKDEAGNELTSNGIDGVQVTVDANTQPSAFGDFTFGTAIGEWTFIQGKWPAINLPAEVGGAYRPEDQPIDP